MIILIKHFYNSILTSIELRSRNKETILFFFKVFYIRFFFAFPQIRNLTKPKIEKKSIIEKKIFNNNISTKTVLNSIIKKGYFSNLILRKKELQLLKNDIIFYKLIPSFKGKKKNLKKYNNSLKSNDDLKSIVFKSQKFNISHAGFEINLNQAKLIKKLACSKFFLTIAKNYFNTNDISISSQCYISNPYKINEQEKKNNAQYFHYDLEFKKFFKVFIYLNKVDEFTGPHVYLEKSHLNKFYKHILAERIDDDQIRINYKNNIKKIFYGSEGAVILEDTFGLHKGETPVNKTRALLILIYGIGEGIKDYNFLIKP